MKINKVELKNFQKHKTKTVEFNPGVTSIKGETDAGKSSIFRALRWCGSNADLGAGIATFNTSDTAVTINDTVTKRRKRGKLTYEMGGESFANVAKGKTPDEIALALNLGPENFQGQHDVYFLIGESAGSVARKLNEVADLQKIDQSRKIAKEQEKFAALEVKSTQKSLERIEDELTSLSWVDTAAEDFGAIESVNESGSEIELKVDRVNDQCQEILSIELVKVDGLAEDIKLCKNLLESSESIDPEPLIKLIGQIKKLKAEIPDIELDRDEVKALGIVKGLDEVYNHDLVLKIASVKKAEDELILEGVDVTADKEALLGLINRDNSEDIKTLVNAIAKTAESNPLKTVDIAGDITKLSFAGEKLDSALEKFKQSAEALGSAVKKDQVLREAVENLKRLKEEFKQQDLGICPTCHGEVKADNILKDGE